jgi:hypothetical protein
VRLTELSPKLIEVAAPGRIWNRTESLPLAQGLRFSCPKCGYHEITVLFADRGVQPGENPGPERWTVTGTSLADVTLSPEIEHPGCGWSGMVTFGEVTTVS